MELTLVKGYGFKATEVMVKTDRQMKTSFNFGSDMES